MKKIQWSLIVILLVVLTVVVTKKLSAQSNTPNRQEIPVSAVPKVRDRILKVQHLQLDLGAANQEAQEEFDKAAIGAGLEAPKYQLFIDPKDGKFYFDPKPDAVKK